MWHPLPGAQPFCQDDHNMPSSRSFEVSGATSCQSPLQLDSSMHLGRAGLHIDRCKDMRQHLKQECCCFAPEGAILSSLAISRSSCDLSNAPETMSNWTFSWCWLQRHASHLRSLIFDGPHPWQVGQQDQVDSHHRMLGPKHRTIWDAASL